MLTRRKALVTLKFVQSSTARIESESYTHQYLVSDFFVFEDGRTSSRKRCSVRSCSSSENPSFSCWAPTWHSYTGLYTVRCEHTYQYRAATHWTSVVFLTTIPLIFQGIYGEPLGIAGLNYIALGIGLSGVSQISARLLDVVYVHLAKKNGGIGKPEYRLREWCNLPYPLR